MRWAFKKNHPVSFNCNRWLSVNCHRQQHSFRTDAAVSLHLSHRLPPETCHHQRTNDIIVVVFIIICPKLPDSFITFPSYAAACSCYSTGAHKQTHAYTQAHTERKETPAQPDTAWTWEVTLSVSRDVSRTSPRSLTHRPQCLYLVRAD